MSIQQFDSRLHQIPSIEVNHDFKLCKNISLLTKIQTS